MGMLGSVDGIKKINTQTHAHTCTQTHTGTLNDIHMDKDTDTHT